MDEFGRRRQVPRGQAREYVGIEFNLDDDYKDYRPSQTRGYHMFPPTADLAGHAQPALTREEKWQREQEAKDEWKGIFLRGVRACVLACVRACVRACIP